MKRLTCGSGLNTNPKPCPRCRRYGCNGTWGVCSRYGKLGKPRPVPGYMRRGRRTKE